MHWRARVRPPLLAPPSQLGRTEPGRAWVLGRLQRRHVTANGGVSSYGDMANQNLNSPIIGITPTPSGSGYWLLGSDGGIFSFGNAVFHGSTGSMHLNKPVVGMASSSDGNGYWLVASDGGIFTYGDAVFHGSAGSLHLNKPIVGMAAHAQMEVATGWSRPTVASSPMAMLDSKARRGACISTPPCRHGSHPLGNGYWLVASDGASLASVTRSSTGRTPGTASPRPRLAWSVRKAVATR